ncbi:SDR family NAD(P)-dependent oxidoreductase [Cohnella nanjingensis]|uniref:SDR family oxidoreductase n=1 Tax=Cohnella nanjingensis TaxID=1387779 RepID=A0A7X0RV83_9BACL|nr:SDR family oxidoreductase [Cohnella nanjingensis]MBB6674181.1 SDR family oxidoreductase [Cohnella nanjingensis]
MTFSQTVAIVTGGASGIGKALGQELAQKRVFVVIADLDAEAGERAASDIVADGGLARFARLDVTDRAQVEGLIAETFKEFGRLDYMFNNAGIGMYGELYAMSNAHWERIVNVNLWGVIHGTQAAYRLMKAQGFGHIANTASATGLGPSPTAAAYATTKHAIVGLTTSLHYEAEAYGIKVSAFCPAFVDTPIHATGEAIGVDRAKVMEQIRKQKPMSPARFARIAIAGLERNEPIICPMPLRRTMDVFFALFPSVHRKLMRLVCRVARQASLDAPQTTSVKQ